MAESKGLRDWLAIAGIILLGLFFLTLIGWIFLRLPW